MIRITNSFVIVRLYVWVGQLASLHVETGEIRG